MNKRKMPMRRRVTAAAAALGLILSPAGVFAGSYGDTLIDASMPIGEQTVLTQGVYWNASVSDKITENHITYTPGGNVIPVVHYGHDIYGAASLKRAVELAQQDGLRVVAAINGDFFNMSNGVAVGPVIKDGILRTSGSSAYQAIGFRADGSAFIAPMNLGIRADGANLGYGIGSMHLNKMMTKAAGVILYTPDYEATTKSKISTVNVVLDVKEGEPKANGTVSAVVESVGTSSGEASIPAGKMVMAMASDTAYTATLAQLSALRAGDEITLTFSADEIWDDAVMAVGGETKLVTQGQNVAKSSSREPRTALGIKADGSIVLYTVDGRQSGYSVGATLSQVAARLIELGCTEAINLDGGGSTTMQAVRIGDSSLVTVNSPSGGSLRSCGNYVLLVNTAEATGEAAHLQLYPNHLVILSGAFQTFTAKAADDGYYAVPVPENLEYEVTGGIGTVDEKGVFTAGSGAGSGTVTVSSGEAFGSADITVVESPSGISVQNEKTGAAVSSVTLKPGEKVDLKAIAYWNHQLINAGDSHFKWTVSGGVGTIDQYGTFTAGEKAAGTGTITVTAGSTSASVAVNVADNSQPFSDMAGHWAAHYGAYLYSKGIVNGVNTPEGLVFRPDQNMTRAEFAVMMSNWLVSDAGSYGTAQLPFADADQIPSWALDAVKAMYAKGIIQGSAEGGELYFYPDQSISRQEVMTIIGRTQPVDQNAAELAFSDADKVAVWALPYVKTMVSKGVVGGMPDGSLNPGGFVTRAQVLKMIYGMC